MLHHHVDSENCQCGNYHWLRSADEQAKNNSGAALQNLMQRMTFLTVQKIQPFRTVVYGM